MPTIDATALVGDTVVRHPGTAGVFERFRIDFCCGGRVSIQEACRDDGVDCAALVAALEQAVRAEGGPTYALDPARMSTAVLLAYIVDVHHGYLRGALPRIEALAAKVARVHGAHEPKLVALAARFSALSHALAEHLAYEEKTLFPALGSGTTEVAAELARMRGEHAAVGAALDDMRALANDYAVPSWACASYRALFAELSVFEQDVHQHVHLENNVLAPRLSP